MLAAQSGQLLNRFTTTPETAHPDPSVEAVGIAYSGRRMLIFE